MLLADKDYQHIVIILPRYEIILFIHRGEYIALPIELFRVFMMLAIDTRPSICTVGHR